MSYTDSFACPQCCLANCETLRYLFSAGGLCPGSIPNVEKEICLNVKVVHDAVKPVSPFGGTFTADCRIGYGETQAWVIAGTTGINADYPKEPLFSYGVVRFEKDSSPANPVLILADIRVPTTDGGSGVAEPAGWYRFGMEDYHSGTSTYFYPNMASLQCSPLRFITNEGPVWYAPNRFGMAASIVGKFHLEITMGLCPTVPIPSPTPLVSHVTTPCKYLGSQIQDPAKCQCGTANLMSCALYGTCRRTGTPLAGESICLTCPDYQSP